MNTLRLLTLLAAVLVSGCATTSMQQNRAYEEEKIRDGDDLVSQDGAFPGACAAAANPVPVLVHHDSSAIQGTK